MSDIARPTNPRILQDVGVDVYEAVRAFVSAYALPAIPGCRVFQGWQNRAALPAGTNDYAVISILFDKQHGTNVETFSAPDADKAVEGDLSMRGLVEISVQIDFCSEDDTARLRARRLAIVTRSPVGVQFFRAFGVSPLFSEDIRDLSFVGDASQFVRRYAVTLHLTVNEGVAVSLPYFDTAKASRVEDVAAHHKPE